MGSTRGQNGQSQGAHITDKATDVQRPIRLGTLHQVSGKVRPNRYCESAEGQEHCRRPPKTVLPRRARVPHHSQAQYLQTSVSAEMWLALGTGSAVRLETTKSRSTGKRTSLRSPSELCDKEAACWKRIPASQIRSSALTACSPKATAHIPTAHLHATTGAC